MKIKTLDVTAKSWFDRINGNSYFSAIVTVNYGMKTAKTLLLPFQYGYGDHFIDIAKDELVKAGLIKSDKMTALWRYCEENKIILRTQKHVGCLKRDVVNWGI